MLRSAHVQSRLANPTLTHLTRTASSLDAPEGGGTTDWRGRRRGSDSLDRTMRLTGPPNCQKLKCWLKLNVGHKASPKTSKISNNSFWSQNSNRSKNSNRFQSHKDNKNSSSLRPRWQPETQKIGACIFSIWMYSW